MEETNNIVDLEEEVDTSDDEEIDVVEEKENLPPESKITVVGFYQAIDMLDVPLDVRSKAKNFYQGYLSDRMKKSIERITTTDNESILIRCKDQKVALEFVISKESVCTQ